MRRRVFLTICTALAIGCGAQGVGSAGAEPAVPAALVALRQTPGYQQNVLRGAANTAAWVDQACAPIKTATSSGLVIVQPPVFDAKGAVQSGEWIEQMHVSGCGSLKQLNIDVTAETPGTLVTVPMLPGTTLADRALQKGGAFYAFTAATPDEKGCKPIYLADTRYVGPIDERPSVPGKPGWTEVWTVAQCETRTDVEMRFKPDATGTNVTSKRLTPKP